MKMGKLKIVVQMWSTWVAKEVMQQRANSPDSQGAERGGKAGGSGKRAGGNNCRTGRTALRPQQELGAAEGQCLAAGHTCLPAAAADTGSAGHGVRKVRPLTCFLSILVQMNPGVGIKRSKLHPNLP